MYHHNPGQSPPGQYGQFSYRQSAMSDTLSVSSENTGVASHPGSRPPLQQQHSSGQWQSYHGQQQQSGQQHGPPSYNGNMPYFYPSSHLHNAPSYHSTDNNHPYGNTPHHYIQSPPIHPQISSIAQPPSLTKILLNSSPLQLESATKHPFLRLAGQGRLHKRTLSKWLSQDRLYAQSYIGFVAALIARVDLPYVYIHPSEQKTSLRWRLIKCLSDSLTNIHNELKFFSDTADKYNLDLDLPPHENGAFTAESATKSYIDLFRAFWTDPSMSLLEGMVVLWATETCYLKAWSYARSYMERNDKVVEKSNDDTDDEAKDRKSRALSEGVMSELEGSEVNTGTNPSVGNRSQPQTPSFDQISHPTSTNQATQQRQKADPYAKDLDGGALRSSFIPNWTSPEFESFVNEIAELTDMLAEREDAVGRKLDVYKAVWRHILDVERRFWPDVGES
jgi:thiaminase